MRRTSLNCLNTSSIICVSMSDAKFHALRKSQFSTLNVENCQIPKSGRNFGQHPKQMASGPPPQYVENGVQSMKWCLIQAIRASTPNLCTEFRHESNVNGTAPPYPLKLSISTLNVEFYIKLDPGPRMKFSIVKIRSL